MTLGYTCLTKHDLDYPSTHGGQASQVPGIAGAASFGWQQGPGQKSLGSTCWRCTYEPGRFTLFLVWWVAFALFFLVGLKLHFQFDKVGALILGTVLV